MTRMADPEPPREDQEYDDERFEDEGQRSIFSALWFRAILVVIVLGVVVAVAVPYVLELANQPEQAVEREAVAVAELDSTQTQPLDGRQERLAALLAQHRPEQRAQVANISSQVISR